MDTPTTLGLLGARSPVGEEIVRSASRSTAVLRFSRVQRDRDQHGPWHTFDEHGAVPGGLDVVVSLIPIWVLAERSDWLEQVGCRRLIALSSTSRFTKADSGRGADRELAERLRQGEDRILGWAAERKVPVTILRPTMIYGSDQDRNVSSIRSTLRRLRFFPVVGRAQGLRQPVHVADVAAAALLVADAPPQGLAPAYNVSGAEVLSYREMVDRVRRSVSGPTFVLRVPGALFRLAERIAPRSKVVHTAAGMADRMSTDMVFDHDAARDDLGYEPRPFDPVTPSP